MSFTDQVSCLSIECGCECECVCFCKYLTIDFNGRWSTTIFFHEFQSTYIVCSVLRYPPTVPLNLVQHCCVQNTHTHTHNVTKKESKKGSKNMLIRKTTISSSMDYTQLHHMRMRMSFTYWLKYLKYAFMLKFYFFSFRSRNVFVFFRSIHSFRLFLSNSFSFLLSYVFSPFHSLPLSPSLSLSFRLLLLNVDGEVNTATYVSNVRPAYVRAKYTKWKLVRRRPRCIVFKWDRRNVSTAATSIYGLTIVHSHKI